MKRNTDTPEKDMNQKDSNVVDANSFKEVSNNSYYKKRKAMVLDDPDRENEDRNETLTTSSGSSTGRLHIIEGLRRQDSKITKLKRQYNTLTQQFIVQHSELQVLLQQTRHDQETIRSLEKQVEVCSICCPSNLYQFVPPL